MNFKQLEAFYWLSQIQNYRQTAEHLGLTQPAVSARIHSLEADLGKMLIDREASGFRLTDQGMEVAEFSLQFLNLRETMNTRLLDNQKQRLAIGIAGMVTMTWGPVLCDMLQETYPELQVNIYSGSDIQLQQFIQAQTLDIAFTASGTPVSDRSFITYYSVGWVAHRRIIEGRKLPMTRENLRSLPLVLYPKTSPLYNPVAKYIDEMSSQPAPRHYGNSLFTICEMVRQGYGASGLALVAVEPELASGQLVRIPTTEEIPPLTVACSYTNRARRQQVNSVLDLAREAARHWCAKHPAYATFQENTG